jgi:hypothetical protein
MTAAPHDSWVMHDPDVLVVATKASDPRMPDAFVGAVAMAATLLASAILVEAHISSGAALAAMVGAVGLVAWWCRPLLAAVPAAFGLLMFSGFFVDRSGDLHWHGWADVARLLALFGVAAVVSLTRAAVIRLTRRVVITEYPIGGGEAVSRYLPESRVAASAPAVAQPPARRGDDHA